MAGCFDKLRAAKSNPINDEILSIYDKHLEDGVSPEDAELKTVLDYHKQLFDDVNTLRTHVNLKPVDYQAYDPTAINAKYDSLAKQQADTVNTPSPDKAAESSGGKENSLPKEPWQMTQSEFRDSSSAKWIPKYQKWEIKYPDGKGGQSTELSIKWNAEASPDDVLKQFHEREVDDHLEFSKKTPVPPEVLADYPDLAAKYGNAESHAQAIDSGDVTVAPQDILKTAGELVDKHEQELKNESTGTQSSSLNDRATEESTNSENRTSDQGNEPIAPKTANPSESAPTAERQTASEDLAAGESGKERGGESGGAEKQRVEPVSDNVDAKESTPPPKADLRVGDRVQDTFGRKGRVYAEKSGELKIEQDGTKARLPLSDKWSLIGKRPLEVNGFKKGDIVAKKDQVGKVYEYGGQLRVKWNKDGKVRSEPLSEKWTKTANSQAGSVDPSLLTLGMDKTVKEDIAPAVRRAGQSVKNAFDDVRKLIFAGNRGESAKLAASSLRAELGKKARSALVAETALKEARGVFAKSPIEDNYDFISHVEGGNLQNLPPAYQPIARELRRLLDESRQRVQDLGTGKLENYIENYFPHIWEDPNKAANVFAKTVAKRPFEGSKAFLKQRTYNTFEEGLDAGLKPVSDNPVDLTLLKIRDMDKYVAAHNTINYLKEKGAAGVVKTGQKPPDGATKIDDKISEVRYINDKGELVTSGHLYADEPAATVINNFLSPGLTGSKFAAVRDAYKTWKYVGNLMNQAQLGLSAFHAAFTTIDAATSKMAAGINQLAQGRPVTALRSFAEVPVSPITNLIRGDKIYREGLTPGSTDAYSQAMADLVTEAGGRFKMDDFYHTKAAQKMMDAFKRGNLLGGLVRTPSAALDIASRPLMEWLVPRQKLGVFADLAKNTVDRLGPDATKDQLREALGKDWDTVDNRMGQLVYDNLFWNKTVKDLAMASVRSVGWNLGDIRELGGAVKDTITLPRRVQRSYKGENMPVPVVTQRMAYAMALPLMSGMIGAVTQYLFTGQGPQELKDYFFPKTGNTDENGNPERLNLPTYMKDVYAYADHPLKTLANKAHPLIGLTSQMLSNKDYYGTEIRNSDDPFVQQLTDLAKHVGKSFLPFSLQGAMKEKERQGSPTTKALSFFGFNPAPKNIDTTKAQDLAYEIYAQSKGDEPKTKEAAARNKEIGDLVRLRKLGKDDDFQTEYQKAVKAGVISPADMKSINQRMKGSFFQYAVGRMTIDDAVKVYEIATPEEKTLLQKQMTTKINNAQAKGHITPQVAKKLADLGLKDIPAKATSDDEDQ